MRIIVCSILSKEMKILDFNDAYVLASGDQKTYLLRSPSLQLVSECTEAYRIGSLQYATGIAALGTSSQVRFYDFKYERHLEQIETVLKLVHVKIIKNLLFCTSAQRILIYDLATRSNLCHIPTSNGPLATLNSDYYNLKLLYPVSQNVYHEQEIWKNRTKKIECSPCSIIRYDRGGEILCLAQENVIALYENQEIVRGCSFDEHVLDVVPSRSVPRKFYVRTLSKIEPFEALYIQVSIATKTYLKLGQQIGESWKPCENQLYFEHKGNLIVWKGTKIYKTQIDLEPKLGNAKIEWQKQNNCEFRVSNKMIEHTEEEERLQAEYLKEIQKEILAKQEEEKMSNSKKNQIQNEEKIQGQNQKVEKCNQSKEKQQKIQQIKADEQQLKKEKQG